MFSFNGNKIITTSGGGALIGNDTVKIERARYLSTQAREQLPYYEHTSTGYNYRMSNICAAIGCGQIEVIDERVKQKRTIYNFYKDRLQHIDGVSFIPIDIYGYSNCWLTAIIINRKSIPLSPEELRVGLEQHNIESRPLWKPMHLQPVFANQPAFLNGASEHLFTHGLCLPSGTSMKDNELRRVASIILSLITK